MRRALTLLISVLWVSSASADDPVQASVPLIRGTWLTPELRSFLLAADSVSVSCGQTVQDGEKTIRTLVPGAPLTEQSIAVLREWLTTPGAVRRGESSPIEPYLGLTWWCRNEFVPFVLCPVSRGISYTCPPDRRGEFFAAGIFDSVPSNVERELDALVDWATSLSEESPN